MDKIQWFPGHMTGAIRMMEENVSLVDGIIIVLDARAPLSSLNAKLNKLFAGKPKLYLINKSDLVSRSDLNAFLRYFESRGENAVAICSTERKSVDIVYKAIAAALKERIERNKRKGIFMPMRVMVAGIPNTGKSTVINLLSGEKRAKVGDKAGVTRGKQWVRLNDIELLDTPGTMPPSIVNQKCARHLAYIGCINDDILDMTELAVELIKETFEKNRDIYLEKYKLTDTDGDVLGKVAAARGYLMRGGEYDYDRAAGAVIDDFRKGRLGKLILDDLDILKATDNDE